MQSAIIPVTIKEQLAKARAHIAVDYELATATCAAALAQAQAADDVDMEAEALHLSAQILFSHGEMAQAISQINKAIAIRETIKDNAKLSHSLNSLGIFLAEIGDFTAALNICYKSLRIREELLDVRGIAAVLINIGHIYMRLNNIEEQVKVYERALHIAIEINDKPFIASIHLNLGNLYCDQSDFKRALEYLDGLDAMFISLGDKIKASYAFNHSGLVYEKMGQLDKAMEMFNQCLVLAKETGDTNGIASSLMNIGHAKIRIGLAEEAKSYIEEAIILTESNQLRASLKEAKLTLSDCYAAMHDYKNAYETYVSYTALKDEQINANNLKQVSELKMKYDTEKREKEAEINHLKNVELKLAFDNLNKEKIRSDELLLNILPEEVAEEIKTTGSARAKRFDSVSVMFIDIRNFTLITQQLSPEDLVAEIDFVFKGFDEIIKRYDIEKIKTIGDAYMCASGLPIPYPHHALNMVDAAFDIIIFMETVKQLRLQEHKTYFEVRIGINSGAVVAGIVGSSKFAYDIWGDTVNTAARIEQNSEVGKINISDTTYELVKDRYTCTYRGEIEAKNKGKLNMYFVSR